MSPNILFIVLPIAGSMLLAWGLFQVVLDLRSAKQRKILDRLTESRATARQREIKEQLLRKSVGDQQGNILESVVAKLQIVNTVQKLLDQADVDWLASRMLVNLGGLALLTSVGLILFQMSIVSCLAVSLGILTMPLLWVVHKRRKRIKLLINQLPDVFELMSQALRAGHPLASAIQLVSQQMPDPIAGEFGRVFYEQNLGIKVEDALLNMAQRVDQMDVRFFVTAVLIQRQTGGDLAEVLEKIGTVIRGRIQLLGTVQALTAEGRLSGWVLLLLPVVVFGVSLVINPDYARVMIETPTGRMMLGIAIAMDLMGMAMIKKIVNIKV